MCKGYLFTFNNKQTETARMIERIYGDIKKVEILENHNILVTYKFWGDSYSGYEIKVVIDERGKIAYV